MTFSMAGAISQDRQRCQFPFLLDEKPTFVPLRLGRRAVGRCAKGAARSNSERAASSACVGRRFCFVHIVWNRSTRRAGAGHGAGRQAQMAEEFDNHRWIFNAHPGPAEGAAMIFKAPQFGQCSMSMSKTRLSSLAQLMRGVSQWSSV